MVSVHEAESLAGGRRPGDAFRGRQSGGRGEVLGGEEGRAEGMGKEECASYGVLLIGF